MLDRKWLGDKAKGGFYKKVKGGEGKDERLTLDWKTLEYHPRQKPKFPALDMAKNIEDTGARLRTLLRLEGTPQKGDKAGAFLWAALSDLWTYSANRIPEISDSIVEIDRAMRLGFNWELGPFELWDAAGVEATVARMKKEGKPVAANVEKLLASGKKSWYADDPKSASGRMFFDLPSSELQASSGSCGRVVGHSRKKIQRSSQEKFRCVPRRSRRRRGLHRVPQQDELARLRHRQLDHSIPQARRPRSHFDAFIITNDATNFSVGANLMLLLMSAQEEEWDEVDLAIRQFQGMTQAIKFSLKPVVVSAFGLCLGGGTEISLHAAARQPHAELYTGLVEVGVGLLPGGGGCKEMLLRAVDSAESIRPGGRGESIELMEAMKRAFETIATAKVATSAHEARGLGFLSASDNITMNRERLLSDAKTRALELVRADTNRPSPGSTSPPPAKTFLPRSKWASTSCVRGTTSPTTK